MYLRPSFRSLFWRLFAGLTVVILATAALVSVTAYLTRKQDLGIGTIDWRISGQKSVEAALLAYRYGGETGLVDWLTSPSNHNPTVYLLAENGRELSGRPVPQLALEMLAALKEEGRLPANESDGGAVRTIEIAGHPYMVFATRTNPSPLKIRFLPMQLRGLPLVLIGFLTTLIVFGVAWVLALYYTRPLRRLDQAMERFSLGELKTRVEASIGPADDEIATLARVFDQMAERIEGLIERQRRLFHDVSHEVRSPLARIDVALELARRDPSRVASSLDRIEKEVASIDRLIEALLTYARLENNAGLREAPVDVEALLGEAGDNARFEAETRAVRVESNWGSGLFEGAELLGDGPALLRAIDNVVRNAIRFTPEGGVLELKAQCHDRTLELLCRDEGPGVPPEELPDLFRPFVRGKRESTGTGFGLGLAIAQKCVEGHKGRLEATNRTDGRTGLVVRFTLPLERSPRKGTF